MQVVIDTDWLRNKKYKDVKQATVVFERLYKQGYNDAVDSILDKLEKEEVEE